MKSIKMNAIKQKCLTRKTFGGKRVIAAPLKTAVCVVKLKSKRYQNLCVIIDKCLFDLACSAWYSGLTAKFNSTLQLMQNNTIIIAPNNFT